MEIIEWNASLKNVLLIVLIDDSRRQSSGTRREKTGKIRQFDISFFIRHFLLPHASNDRRLADDELH